LAAAQANQLAGAPGAASALVDTASSGPLDDRDQAMVEQLRGQIALHLSRAARRLPCCSTRADGSNQSSPSLRATHTSRRSTRRPSPAFRICIAEVASAARAAPPRPGQPRAADLLLDGLALRFGGDFASSAPILRRAMTAFRADDAPAEHEMRWPLLAVRAAADRFDDDSWAFCSPPATCGIARENGALASYQSASSTWPRCAVFEGKLEAAAELIEETDSLIDATGGRRIGLASCCSRMSG